MICTKIRFRSVGPWAWGTVIIIIIIIIIMALFIEGSTTHK